MNAPATDTAPASSAPAVAPSAAGSAVTGCPFCDDHSPSMGPSLYSDSLDLHRAAHDLVRVVVTGLRAWVRRHLVDDDPNPQEGLLGRLDRKVR